MSKHEISSKTTTYFKLKHFDIAKTLSKHLSEQHKVEINVYSRTNSICTGVIVSYLLFKFLKKLRNIEIQRKYVLQRNLLIKNILYCKK